MARRFRVHDVREVTDLGGFWDFTFLGDAEPDKVSLKGMRYDDRIAVPGCFDATPRYAAKRGLCVYRKTAVVRDTTPHRLVLDGVHHWARVFIDGKRLCDHVGGFTTFSADFTPARAGEIEIVVLVDNRINYQRCPLHLDYFDWFHFGGIARGVELHRLGKSWIDAVRFDTLDFRQRRVKVEIDVRALRATKAALHVRCAGAEARRQVNLSSEPATVELTLQLPGAKLWSSEEPNLHELYVTLGEDDLRQRVGLRQVKVQGQKILLNGKPLRLLGVCRHESHPLFGHGLPEALLAADVQILKDLGANFVRGSHYPQDSRFLDLCDEAGILVWSEGTAWQPKVEHLTDPHFMNAMLNNLEEMVAAARNHPSVILWGICNEGDSFDPRGREGYKAAIEFIRKLDPSRPVTYATMHAMRDICYDLADVISVNTYPGWYSGELKDIPSLLNKIFDHVDGVGQKNKPLIISEIGAAAMYGWRDMNNDRWSEAYQSKLHDIVLKHLFVTSKRACGISIWQYCDIRTSEQVARVLGRPRQFNNKGIVDEYRRPKLAFETVKKRFHELAK